MAIRLSRYKLHVKQWSDCQECYLHERRNNVVMAKGKVPCDILIVGEGPGQSEDIVGKPFCGPAGKLLDIIVDKSIGDKYRVAYSNLVCCIPIGDDGVKAVEPEEECIQACKPRLEEFISMCKPRLIICAGRLADKYLEWGYKHSVKAPKEIPRVLIDHPAYILRADMTQRGMMIQKAIAIIVSAVIDYLQVDETKQVFLESYKKFGKISRKIDGKG